MKTKTIFISFISLFLLSSLTTLSKAQRRPSTKIKAKTSNTIAVLKVKPGNVNSRISNKAMANVKVVKAAALSTAAKKKAWVKGHGTLPPPPPQMGNIKPPPKGELTNLVLSAKDPHRGAFGYLEFNEVRHMDCKEDYVVWYNPNPGMGYMKAFVKLEKGSKYLVDFNISHPGPGSREFHLGTTGGSQNTSFTKGSHHLVTIIEATTSGTSQMMLWADQDWTFHNVEITRIE